jgi:hypothetical protein
MAESLPPKTPNILSLKNKDLINSWSMGLASDAPQETPLPKELFDIENDGIFSILRKRNGHELIFKNGNFD